MSARVVSVLLPMVLLLGGCSTQIFGNRQAEAQQTTDQQGAIAPYDIDVYAEVLSTYVDDDGWVNYAGLQADRAGLDQFNASLNTLSPEVFAEWSESERIAFLINAYNSFTLKSIIDQTPLKSSIKDIPGVWKFRRHEVLADSMTLDHIEHGILRKEYSEPRIHAALVCGARSCPPLRNEPYTGEQLEEQLEDQVMQWFEGPYGLEIDRENNTVSISSIFDWFGEDWKAAHTPDSGFSGSDTQKAVLNFISAYLEEADAEYLRSGGYRVKYLNYDWSLNDQR
ncbi:MAG: DUF547 domain-containing protein [Symploca sp. SIO2B6]|nr:DUF547 domain-containing protein [Symploca sp. SIO2B6]